MIRRLAAFRNGLVDGWHQPHELTCGMTFDDPALNRAYDRGVNAGQHLRSPFNHERA